MATSSYEGEAGWDANQEQCIKWMNNLTNFNNSFANPNCDYVAFRAAVDEIVQSEFDNQKSETLPCTLSQFVYGIYRRVWHTVKPCKSTRLSKHSQALQVSAYWCKPSMTRTLARMTRPMLPAIFLF